MAVTNVELLKLGLRIRALRKVLGRSQKDFAKQCGLDRSYFGGVERGERNLTFFSLCEICAGLDCDIAAVTRGIPYREPLRSSRNARGLADSSQFLGVQVHLSSSNICLEEFPFAFDLGRAMVLIVIFSVRKTDRSSNKDGSGYEQNRP